MSIAGARAVDRVIALPGHRYVTPANRWDLLDQVTTAEPPTVSVVIAYFEAQERLDRLLLALSMQTHPSARLQVIVADDGSRDAPRIDTGGGLQVRVVRQADRGFRAAAARNLGVRAADGDVLCFLDDDMVPEPDYVTALTRWPALLPDALVTGRRRHGVISAMSSTHLEDWLRHRGVGPVELPEPQWLSERYAASGNLLRLAPDAYRFVISAVMACGRSLFDELGGFDESFVRYGGEDWEFAHRAVCAGAVLAHVPDAVAWHDGVSWGERADPEARRRDKNRETATLARLIPDPSAAGRDWTGRPDVVVEIGTDDEEDAAVIVGVRSVLAGEVDAGVWLCGSGADRVKRAHFALEPRVGIGPVPPSASSSARVVVSCPRPVRVRVDAWAGLLDGVREGGTHGQFVIDTGDAVVTVTASRALARARRWRDALPGQDLVGELFGRAELTPGGAGVTAIGRHPDLAHELAHLTDG